MKKSFIVFLISLVVQLCATGLFAEKVIYIHGMNLASSNEQFQDTTDAQAFSYWRVPVGDYVFVGYDGRRDPFLGIPTSGSMSLLALLNKYCRADQGQSCRIVSDSLGGLTTAGTVSMYNQTGLYNILYTTQIVSAEGGSEIANLGDTAINLLLNVLGLGIIDPLNDLAESRDAIQALMTSNARAKFDHNRTNGAQFYHVAFNKSMFLAEPFLPGEDDMLVAFHSSCAYRETGAFNKCMGQAIRSCSWCFWQRKRHISAFDGHYMLPGVSLSGVDAGHNDAERKSNYYYQP